MTTRNDSGLASAATLMQQLAAGERKVVMTFAGQGAPWIDELAELHREVAGVPALVARAEATLRAMTETQALRWSGLYPHDFALQRWLTQPSTRPLASALDHGAVSQPMTFVTQIARFLQLRSLGLQDAIRCGSVVAVAGHSQGSMAAAFVAECGADEPSLDRFAAYLRYVAWQGFEMAMSWRDCGGERLPGIPIASVAGPTLTRLRTVVDRVNADLPTDHHVHISLYNGRTRHVVTGVPASVARLRAALEATATKEAADRKAGRTGGAVLRFVFEELALGAAYHGPAMTLGLERDARHVAEDGFRIDAAALKLPVGDPAGEGWLQDAPDVVARLLLCMHLLPVRWPATCAALADRGARDCLDLGPGIGVARLTASGMRGRGVAVHAMAERAGRAAVLVADAALLPSALRYADFAPTLARLPDGRLLVDNRYTRLTGQSPAILPGMTPTTVDAPIVAAAANAGFTAELAGGGQVTADMLQARIDELRGLLAPGHEVTFNALFLDRYLWDLQLGARGLVQKARKRGAPICGVTISAGIPDVEEATRLLAELNAAGLWLNAFKPGTGPQIEQVVRIAKAAPQVPVLIHVEGGKAGGHHSWEDLEDLLIAHYEAMRGCPNVVLCVGGGIGDEARGVEMLSGRWSLRHDLPLMPVDGILLGTVTMACLEATASPQVKAALVNAAGSRRWVGRGAVDGGITSGRSQLDADIHYLDNAAARCGRLLDAVAGDASAIEARRDEIIAALNATAKPFFGDVEAMTWAEVLTRFVALTAVGRGGRYEDGRWPDSSYRQRCADLFARAEARLCAEVDGVAADASVPSVVASLADLDAPEAALQALLQRYPHAAQAVVAPPDARYFVRGLCRSPGKPVNFVPVVDVDVRRWYKSDALWQAQDDRFSADQVLIIPGPEAVAGIRQANEPVASLLGRFEAAVVTDLLGAGAPIRHLPYRRIAADVSGAPLGGVVAQAVAAAEAGGEESLQLRVVADAAEPWFAAVAARHGGAVARAFGEALVQGEGGMLPSPLRALCPASLGATLTLRGDAAAPRELTWCSADGQERVTLRDGGNGGVVRVEASLRPATGMAPTPWRMTLRVDAEGRCHRVADADGASDLDLARAFYHGSLFGSQLTPVALFDAATAEAVVDAARCAGYAALVDGDPTGVASGLCFSLAWRPIMAVLSCDPLIAGLARLVHLEQALTPGAGWPLRSADVVAVEARAVRVEDSDAGRLVVVEALLRRGDAVCATMTSRFLIRGALEPAQRSVVAREQIAATWTVGDAGQRAFLADHPAIRWAQPKGADLRLGDVLSLRATLTEGRGPLAEVGALAQSAEGVIERDGVVLGSLVMTHAKATAMHPLRALLAVVGADAAGHVETPARTLARGQGRAPADLAAWADVSLDRNPIHLSPTFARLAGLPGPIVHGMWTAAKAWAALVRHVAGGEAERVLDHSAHFEAPLLPGEAIDWTVRRVGVDRGRRRVVVEVRALRGQEPVTVLRMTATLAAPRTAYLFPGQGIQQTGMGMDGYARSAAARAVWDEADAFTRRRLGFSILRVVRENPRELLVDGVANIHDKGVLHLTQFTQVAMAVLARAQVAELRASGVLVPGAITAGHSVGEYNAISAIADVLSLEAVVEAVWQRGLTMHTFVPRDEHGASAYGMGVIRPDQAGLDHAGAEALVRAVRDATGGFLQIVNFNVRGRQYATVGDLATLAALRDALAARQRPGAKAAWVDVPGVDVPFHSEVLTAGVPAFRDTLQRVLPKDGPYLALIGRYVPNLVALPFALTRAFADAIVAATGSTVAAGWGDAIERAPDRQAMAREVLAELLAWQFARPVRWIETMELLLTPTARGGLGAERVVEVGVGYQPTVANMVRQTVALGGAAATQVEIVNAGADLDVVLHRDVDAEAATASEADAPSSGPVAPTPSPLAPAPAATASVIAAPAAPSPASAHDAPADRPVRHLDALRALCALQAKVRPEQIRLDETIDGLLDGVSSRRNQVLMDIGAEFSIQAIDGAHDKPIAALAAEIAKRSPGYKAPGAYLKAAQDEALRRVFGRAGLGRKDVVARIRERYGAGEGLAESVLIGLCLHGRDGDSTRGGRLAAGATSAASRGDVDGVLDAIAAATGAELGVNLAPLAVGGGGGGGGVVDAAAVAALEAKLIGPEGILTAGLRDVAARLGSTPKADDGADAAAVAADRARLATLDAEHGAQWAAWVAPQFSAQRHVAFSSQWAFAQRDVAEWALTALRSAKVGDSERAALSRLGRFFDTAGGAGEPRLVSTARFYAERARAAGRDDVADSLEALCAREIAVEPPLRPTRPTLEISADGQIAAREVPVAQGASAEAAIAALPELLEGLFGGAQPSLQIGAGGSGSAALRDVLTSGCKAPLSFAGRTAVVTGASPGSIAVEVVRHLLRGGARVVVTTSTYHEERLGWYRRLYQREASLGAELHVVPFNQASVADVDALVAWLFAEVSEAAGAGVRVLKRPFAPEIVVPFAAIGDAATVDTLGPRAELGLRAMLFGVERLVAGIAARYRDHGRPSRPCHVLLPLSPNHGSFGGDGAYAEAKAGLEALLAKWTSERDAWAASTSLCAARIGWVRGTGLMDANDAIAAPLEAATGVRTFSSAEMGWILAGLAADPLRALAADAVLEADLTGRFATVADVRAVVAEIREDIGARSAAARNRTALAGREAELLGIAQVPKRRIQPLPAFAAGVDEVAALVADAAAWKALPAGPRAATLADTVVIVGMAELGPCGSSRTRFQLEVRDRLSDAAVLELAWLCGLVRWSAEVEGGAWVDVESGAAVAEADLGERYHDAVRGRVGIRFTEPAVAGFDPERLPVLATAWLDRDFTFAVASQAEAESFVLADPAHTRIAPDPAGDGWRVTRTAGAEIRVPRVARLSRRVLGQLPTGMDLARFGVPGDMVETVDRIALVNLCATADAFLSAGLSPEALLARIHPARVANTQGSGIGGMRSLTRLYTDHLLGVQRQNDIVQETLINVIAAYVVQAYVGSYGSMSHPVGACATAAVSLEEAYDKIRADKADFVVAGGYDDVGSEGTVGFADMAATADTDQMLGMGLNPAQMSRANDIRRRGFVEGQGGGTFLITRGDVAAELGLPVCGVLAWAGSFGDGVHKSIPAPGLGAIASARGGAASPLGRALSRHGLSADDIAFVSKHDTSTAANDPNEAAIHQQIQVALGRSAGNPLFTVSQKTLTGHAKGGAAAFQAIGACQAMVAGIVPGNRNLESVDPAMRPHQHIAFTDRPLIAGRGALRAALVTSLGFGHASAIALLLHPAAYVAMLDAERRAAWQASAGDKLRQARQRQARIWMGEESLFERRSDRRFAAADGSPAQVAEEAAMLLAPTSRLGEDGVYDPAAGSLGGAAR